MSDLLGRIAKAHDNAGKFRKPYNPDPSGTHERSHERFEIIHACASGPKLPALNLRMSSNKVCQRHGAPGGEHGADL